ncbi:MAG TPA: protein kinase, partial [Kofleriaceae bacterium]|nr:protein kinase [Kofleriaceae bacterium]
MPDRLGPYRLDRRLAVGGTAEIWLARGNEAGSPLAVKRMLPELRVHPEALDLFTAEARLAARCAHPHVSAIVGSGQDGDERWISMEHLDGGDLTAFAGPAPLAAATGAALRALLDLLAALEHVHACGVVHADVNPRNVLLRGRGEAVLIDFGVAC